MATLGNLYPTYTDVIKGLDGDNRVAATVVELLSKRSKIVSHAPVTMGNLDTGERVVIRDSLPTASFYRLYEGSASTKGTTKQIDEICAKIHHMHEVDMELETIAPDIRGFMMQQMSGAMQAVNQKMETTLFYGNANTEVDSFHGFAPRYNSLSGDTSAQIVDGGGASTDNGSIYIVGWSPDTVHMAFPKNSSGGVRFKYRQDVPRVNNNKTYFANVGEIFWDIGLVVRDRRYVGRLANLSLAAINSYGSGSDTSPKLNNQLHDLVDTIYDIQNCQPAIYMPRRLKTLLSKIADNKGNMNFTWGELGGYPQLMFRGIPIFEEDALLFTEARVV